ncbi:MAG: DUF4038 domain-containing protein [Spirochaetota bacterium]
MADTVHVWELVEVELSCTALLENPYTQVEVWVDLAGPDFARRVYGFWDGDNRFVVRLVATRPGSWRWTSGASVQNVGLDGQSGAFTAVAWSAEEVERNPCRRGFLRATPNGHGFQYADGTPHYYLADTWWATPTFRYPWVDGEQPLPEWAAMSFQELVEHRRAQGYTGVAMLAAFPHWGDDGEPSTIVLDDGTPVRQAWQRAGSADSSEGARAKEMHNEGGRPFAFPGRVPGYERVVPDFDRLNPDYFKYMDRKVAYLNEQGMIPFIEVSRRDAGPVWKRFYAWPDSYARFIHYIFARYQAYNVLLSPIHYDYNGYTLPSREYNEPANLVVDRYGPPPFGTLVGTNSSPSSLVNFGGPDEARWLTFHQIGNWRPHDNYWYLTEIHQAAPARPALNGEPYYPGFPDNDPPAPSETAARYCRSGIYGSLLSGGLAGYIYGAEGMWGGNVEPESTYTIWDAARFQSGGQVSHVLTFLDVCGGRWSELVPEQNLLVPNQAGDPTGYDGWSYCAYLPGKKTVLLYFESGAPETIVRSLLPDAAYELRWFDPRRGEWNAEPVVIETDQTGRAAIPARPDEEDWGACLVVR